MQVLLTRPIVQNNSIKTLLLKNGYTPLLFPSLEIIALRQKPINTNFDVIIFISVNAVNYGIKYLKKLINKKVSIATIGNTTKKCVEGYGLTVNVSPSYNYSSKSLLATKYFSNISGKNILIVRGRGGKEVLKNKLTLQNNKVEYLEVYYRKTTTIQDIHTKSLTAFMAKKDGFIIINSIDTLIAFLQVIKLIKNSYEPILKYPVIAFSNEIADKVKDVGFNKCFVSTNSDDMGILSSLNSAKIAITK